MKLKTGMIRDIMRLFGVLAVILPASLTAQNFDFCDNCAGNGQDCVIPPVESNPPLTALCAEMDILLIIDESTSILGFEDQVEEGVLDFVAALVGTGVEMAVMEFDSNGTLVTDYVPADPGLLTSMTNYFNGIPFNGETYQILADQGTNWMGALQAALELDTADLILFFTDGNPTFYITDEGVVTGCPGGGLTTQVPDIVNPMLIANYIKESLGSHIFMMGVGDVADSVALRLNLQRLSGNVEFEQGVTEFQTSDYALGNFATLAEELRAFAIEICGTQVSVDIAPDRDSVCVGETVTFTVTVTNTGADNPAQSLMIRDTFPPGFTNFQIVSGTGACVGAGCDPDEPANVLLWQPGVLPPFGSATLLIQATMTSSGNFMNPVWLSGSNVNTFSVTWSVFVVPPPEANAGPDVMLCAGDATTLSVSATGGYGDYSYLWNTNQTMSEIDVMPAVTTTYTVTVTDRNGCNDTDDVQVMIKPLPTADIPDTSAQCTETPFVLNLNGNPEWTYQWSPPEYFDDPNSPSPTAMVPGSGTISVIVNDGMCTGMDEVFIDATEIPNVDIGDADTSCFGAPIVLNPNGNTNFTYLWSPAGLLNDPTLPNPIADINTSTTFYVTITNQTADMCSRYDSIFVFVPPDINLGAPNDTAYCDGPPITLTATGSGVDFIWYDADGNVIDSNATITVAPQVETTYIVEGTDIYGCEVQENVTLTPTFFQYELSDSPILCINEMGVISVFDNGQNLSYQWSPTEFIKGPADQASITVCPPESTLYTVLITNEDLGCVTTDSVLVNVTTFDPDSLIIIALNDSIIVGESFILMTNQPPSLFYFWDGPNIDNPNLPIITATPPTGTYSYSVTVTDNFGCELSAVISNLTVFNPLCNMEDIFVPDAFSPNGDGENDELFVYGNFITALELRIFNRWGEQVFETNDQNVGWDGTYNGKELPTDVFGYYLRVECPPDKMYFTKGNITLLK